MKEEAVIAVLYNAPVSYYNHYTGKPGEDVTVDTSETGFAAEIEKIEESLKERFTRVYSYPVTRKLGETVSYLLYIQPDAVLNLVESVEGISTFEANHAGIFELLGLAYTGNTPLTLGNCLNKGQAKHFLAASGLPTPGFMVFGGDAETLRREFKLRFPVITKLMKEDASIGISENSVVRTMEQLLAHLSFLRDEFRQEIIIEEYIEGREFNCAVLCGEALPVSEIDFAGLPGQLPKIVTYEGKWVPESSYYTFTKPVCPANVPEAVRRLLTETALKAYAVLECRDYARVDIRLSADNIPFIIEVNPNPDISTDSGFMRAAAAAGLSYTDVLHRITSCALSRKNEYDQALQAV